MNQLMGYTKEEHIASPGFSSWNWDTVPGCGPPSLHDYRHVIQPPSYFQDREGECPRLDRTGAVNKSLITGTRTTGLLPLERLGAQAAFTPVVWRTGQVLGLELQPWQDTREL